MVRLRPWPKRYKQPERIQVARRNTASQQIKQSAYAVTNADKTDVLLYLIKGGRWHQTLVFTRTKRRADQVAEELLQEGVSAVAIHGDRHQRERLAALEAFTRRGRSTGGNRCGGTWPGYRSIASGGEL